jgi:hypothetical protein
VDQTPERWAQQEENGADAPDQSGCRIMTPGHLHVLTSRDRRINEYIALSS